MKSLVFRQKTPVSNGISPCFLPKISISADFWRNYPFAGKSCPRTIQKLD